jgi:hypothetical protein
MPIQGTERAVHECVSAQLSSANAQQLFLSDDIRMVSYMQEWIAEDFSRNPCFLDGCYPSRKLPPWPYQFVFPVEKGVSGFDVLDRALRTYMMNKTPRHAAKVG